MRVLVRLDGEPLGYVEGPAWTVRSVPDLLERLPGEARDLVLRRRGGAPAHDPLAAVVADVTVTVVVCTRQRAETLERCLRHLGALTYPHLDVLVVDNAPLDDSTRLVVADATRRDPRVRYAAEPRPGLSRARNRGLSLATGDVVAFTDDDVRVDPLWVHALVRGFGRRDDVACVTGLAAAASLDTAVEAYFDARVSWAKLRPARLFDLDVHRGAGALYPFAAGVFGTGANFAVRRSTALAQGGFDEHLGAGARTRGGEDLDAFVQVLLAGHALAFEPAALVWHHHRSTLEELRHQMYAYGTGLTAFYAKLLADPRSRRRLLRAVPAGLARLATTVRGSGGAAGGDRTGDAGGGVDARAARGLLVRELAGMVAGPFLYVRARTSTGG